MFKNLILAALASATLAQYSDIDMDMGGAATTTSTSKKTTISGTTKTAYSDEYTNDIMHDNYSKAHMPEAPDSWRIDLSDWTLQELLRDFDGGQGKVAQEITENWKDLYKSEIAKFPGRECDSTRSCRTELSKDVQKKIKNIWTLYIDEVETEIEKYQRDIEKYLETKYKEAYECDDRCEQPCELIDEHYIYKYSRYLELQKKIETYEKSIEDKYE